MRIDPDRLSRSARALADAGAFVERAAHAARPSISRAGRVGAVISLARLGVRLLPTARRLLRRYPLGATLVVAACVGGWYLAQRTRESSRG